MVLSAICKKKKKKKGKKGGGEGGGKSITRPRDHELKKKKGKKRTTNNAFSPQRGKKKKKKREKERALGFAVRQIISVRKGKKSWLFFPPRSEREGSWRRACLGRQSLRVLRLGLARLPWEKKKEKEREKCPRWSQALLVSTGILGKKKRKRRSSQSRFMFREGSGRGGLMKKRKRGKKGSLPQGPDLRRTCDERGGKEGRKDFFQSPPTTG